MFVISARPEPTALDHLMAKYAEGVFRYLCSLVGDSETARDLQQETFLKLHNTAKDTGKAFVFTVARNCALDFLRRCQSRNCFESPVDPESIPPVPAAATTAPDRALQNKQLRHDIIQALATMTEEHRTVFHLSEIEGISYQEIASILNVSPGTIASRKHHAVIKLRTYLRSRGHAN